MKKLVSLVLALLMMLSCVSFASAEGPIELEFWHAWGSGANYEAIVKLVNDFNAANEGKIHVTETFVGNYAEVLSKVTVGYSANENPAVNVIDACMTMTHAQNGVMENLSEYARANDPEYDMGTFLPGMMVFSTDGNGDVWSLPYARSTQIMYCNMDLIRDVMGPDAKAPTCWEELYAIAEAYKAKYDKPTYSHDIGGGYFAYYITSMADGEYYNKAGTGACMNINDGWRVALSQWRNSIDKGWYMVPSLSTSGHWAEFKLGNLPISFASTGSLTGALADCQFDLEVCFLPGYKHEDGSIEYRLFTGGANVMMASNKSDEEKAAAWEFIKFITSPESNVYHSFATGYVLNHNGLADLPEVQEKWAAEPARKVAYDQLAYVNETYVSIYTAEIDLEVVDALKAFAMDNLTVEEGYAELENIMTSIFPDGVVETYE
ncbi:MAG: extracellular solute-binding protein [bacterium]|nr:extracellular solute-binding protein [bacterium]